MSLYYFSERLRSSPMHKYFNSRNLIHEDAAEDLAESLSSAEVRHNFVGPGVS